MKFLWEGHRDRANGGYFWSVNDDGPVDATKQGYGHPFVLLAASSAMTIGHPLAEPMLADVSEILDERFWEPTHGAIAEEFGVDWTPVPGYRGQNSNMHLTEALMAAYEATGARVYLERAESIADLVIRRAAGGADWRVIEHFTEDWCFDHTHIGNEMFRPSGTTPGTLAGMVAPAASTLVPGRPSDRVASQCSATALCAGYRPRMGPSAWRLFLHPRLGQPAAAADEALVAAQRGRGRCAFPEPTRPRPGA